MLHHHYPNNNYHNRLINYLVLYWLAIIVIAFFALRPQTPAQARETTMPPELKTMLKGIVQQEIFMQSQTAGVDFTLALEIARAESNFDWRAKNPDSSATGVYQFTTATFLDGIKWRKLGWTLKDRTDYIKNIDMAMWFMQKKQYWRWNESKPKWGKYLL